MTPASLTADIASWRGRHAQLLAELDATAAIIDGLERLLAVIEQPASVPAGAGGRGEATGTASPTAPKRAGAVRGGRRATSPESVGSTPTPRSIQQPAPGPAAPPAQAAAETAPAPVPKSAKTHPAADDEDGRRVDETCPKCGRPFTWKPALLSHVTTCRGLATGRGGA